MAIAVAVGCLMLWRARDRQGWMGWMVLLAAAQAVMAMAQVVRNSCTDIAVGDAALRILGAAIPVFAVGYMGLFRSFCQRDESRFDRILFWLTLAIIPYSLLSPGGFVFTEINGISTIPAGWWGPISVLQGPLDPLAPVVHLLLLLINMRLLWLTLASRTRLDRSSFMLMLLVITAVLVPIIHGFGLAAGWWKGVPLAEYATSTVFFLLCVETFRRERAHHRQERDRQERLEAILEHGQGFAGLLEPDGTLVLANRVALAAINAPASQVLGLPFPETPWWTHSPPAQDRLRAAITKAAAGVPDGFITTHRIAAGGELDVQFSLTPFRGEDGRVRFLIAEGRDVSALRRYERLLREGSRLEAIGQLAGGITHDFNNILAGISGAAELARMRTTDAGIYEYLDLIMNSSRNAGDLTRRLLAHVRAVKSVTSEIRLNALVGETLGLFSRVAGAGIRLEQDLRADPDLALGMPGELQSAVLNLCVNARDAMKGKGLVRVITAREDLAPGRLDCLDQPIAAGTYLRIDVIDSGTGIPEALRKRIFDPFLTTKPDGQGTGLGLPSVLGAMHAHEGAVLLETTEGKGTRMSLLLPAAPAKTTAVLAGTAQV